MPQLQSKSRTSNEPKTRTAYLVVDCESIPDGRLLNLVKYGGEGLSEIDAIEKARASAREASSRGSDFISYSFQIPISVCVARVANDFSLQAVSCLDAPLFRPREIVRKFWLGQSFYTNTKLVTFNGRGFDLPLLELAAFRYGLPAKEYYARGRSRFNGDIDLYDWMCNYGGSRGLTGGLNLLAKLLGKPGKMEVSGDQVYEMHLAGKHQEINEYCLCDTLDTYFVFLRTRVMTGEISPELEQQLIDKAKNTIQTQSSEMPVLRQYLEKCVDCPPWP